MQRSCLILFLVCVFTIPLAVQAAEETAQNTSGHSTNPAFGGPNSPEGQLQESELDKESIFTWENIFGRYDPWHDWKKEQQEKHGIHFTGHYALMYQSVSKTVNASDDDSGASGVLRATGKWDLVGRGTKNVGSLVVTFDHRHAYTAEPPAALAGSAGYAGLTGTFFSDDGFMVINLNWAQSLNDGNSGFIAGRYDPNDYMNILGYVNPWVTFTNIAIALDTSVALPDSSWGVAGGHWFNDQWYVLGGINDANGLGTDDLEFFDGGSEFFKYAHIGWSPSKSARYSANVHLLVWDVDERVNAGVGKANGYALAANWTFGGFMPFVRLGSSDGTSPIYNKAATLGFTQQLPWRSDQVGFAVNWGEMPDGVTKQTTYEAFWNIQVAAGFAVTPDIQFLKNPVGNPDEDVWVLGVRTRLTF